VIALQTNLVLDCVLNRDIFIPFSPHSRKQWNKQASKVYQIQTKGNKSQEERSGLTVTVQG